MKRVLAVVIAVAVLAGAAAYWYFGSGRTRLTAETVLGGAQLPGPLPKAPDHVVIVIEENKDFDDIVGSAHAPFLNQLAREGAVFTHSYGVAHPSQPNYFALFAGTTEREGDQCAVPDISPASPNLGSELLAAHRSFIGYAEGLPADGFRGCTSGLYARKHAPWTHFTNIPAADSRPFRGVPQFETLPTVAMIVPNLDDDMHNGTVARADDWLRVHLGPLIVWGRSHNTLVIITWDESDQPIANHIPTLFIGPMVRSGRYDGPITHYNVLHTVESFYGLPPTGAAAVAPPIAGVWK